MAKPNTRNQGANDERTAILAKVRREVVLASKSCETMPRWRRLLLWLEQRAERCRKRAGGLGRTAALLLLLGLGVGVFVSCAGTHTQRVLLVTSQTAATVVNTAYDTWSLDAVRRARAVLAPNAPPEAVLAQVQSNPSDAAIIKLYNDWRAQMLVWSALNKTLTSGTNAVTVLPSAQFQQDMANLGNQLLAAIEQVTRQPQPRLKS